MPDISLADLLAAYGGGVPDPENPSSGQISPADVLTGLNRVGKGIAQGDVRFTEGVKRSLEDLVTGTRDLMSGATPYYPGLRREDVTDIPAPSGVTQRWEPNDPFIQGTTDISGNLMAAGYGMAPAGSAGIFGGRLGARRLAEAGHPEYEQALAKAEELQAKGVSLPDIYKQTSINGGPGISMGKDGQWRFELPDYQSGWKPEAVENLMPQTVGGSGVQGLTRAGQFSPAITTREGTTAPIEAFYEHPLAMKAYPEAANTPLNFWDPFPAETSKGLLTRGGIAVDGSQMFINPSPFKSRPGGGAPTPETLLTMRDTFLHELQHAAQQAEKNFATGGGMSGPEVSQRAAEIMRQDPSTPRQRALLRAYQQLAGETEARNVQMRRDSPPSELLKNPPWRTQDVDYADQLLRLSEGPGAPMELPARYAKPSAPAPAAAAPAAPPRRLFFENPAQGDFGFQSEPLSFSERMAQAQDIARERANRGQATGDYGLGTARRTAPDAPKGSFEDLAARQRAGFQGDKARIVDEYRAATGQPVAGAEQPLLAPGEEDLSFLRERFAPGAPTVLRPDRPLFDLSPKGLASSHIPREQFDIPRTAAETVTPEYEKATSKANIARVNREVAQGIKEHGLDWHAMGQLRDRYIAELGPTKGAAEFDRYMREVGATSPNSNVEQNFRTASYYAQQRRAGEPLPQISYKRSTGNPYLPPREAPPTPYGNTAQGLHAMNLKLLESGEPYPLSRPKVPSFTENMLGNYRPVAVDRHNLTMWGVDREAPNLTGYKHLERVQQGEAEKMGIHPAQYQAAPWPFYAKSGADPALKLFQNRVMHTAEATGKTPAQVLRDFIRGTGRLLSVTPAAVLLGQAQDQNAPEPAR